MFSEENLKIIISSLKVYNPVFHKAKSVFVKPTKHHSLTFRLSGKISVEANGREVISTPDTITYVPAGLPYTTEVFEGGEMLVVHFYTPDTPENPTHDVFKPSNPALYRNLFYELSDRYKLGREADFMCLSLLYRLLSEIRHEEQSSLVNIPARIREAKSFIDRNFGESNISVSALSRSVGTSEVYFRKEFTEYFGQTPNAYINHVRIENAKELLKTGYYSVAETAMRCGFDSISYFSERFKKDTGISPREFIKNL